MAISIGLVEILATCVICLNFRKPKQEQVCRDEVHVSRIDRLNSKGAGGGYNERDNVEYNERRIDSDAEYDEVERFLSVTIDATAFSLD